MLAFSVRCTVGGSRVHWTHQSESGAQRLVCRLFANLSGYESDEHQTVRCSASGDPESLHTSLSFSPVWTHRAFGVSQVAVRD